MPLHDETNDDVRIPRNLLRLEAMPLLERLNPQTVSALARLADTAGGALDFMEARAGRRVAGDGVGVGWRKSRWTAIDFARCTLRCRGSLCGARTSRPPARSETLDTVHVEGALRLASGPSGKEAELPGGVRMEVRHGELVFHPPGRALHSLPPIRGSASAERAGRHVDSGLAGGS